MVQPWGGGGTEVVSDPALKWLPVFGLEADFSGAGTTTAVLAGYKKLPADFSGEGSTSARLSGYRKIAADFSGEGTTASRLSGYLKLAADFSGAGTFQTQLAGRVKMYADFSGEGILSASAHPPIIGDFSGEGTTSVELKGLTRLAADIDSEGVCLTELVYSLPPKPLDQAHLGKLVRYTVATSAVPANPAEGSGSVPSVNPSYIKGVDPEFVLGQEVEVRNNAIGSYKGEAVKVTVTEGSDVVALSTNTLVTAANRDLHLSPFIDSSPGKWTAARALDYWTQQAGVFYDDVPGDCRFYASGYGHTLAYAGDNDGKRCFGKGDGTGTTVVSGRSVRSFGDAGTREVTAMHDFPDARVPVTLPSNRQLVFSAGIGLRGTGRQARVQWYLEDAVKRLTTVSLIAQSDGAIRAEMNGLNLGSVMVPVDGNYRLTLSIDKRSETAGSSRLTVHTDDLNGNGTKIADSSRAVIHFRLPGVLNLVEVDHTAVGGSGLMMLHWGTYLSVAKAHPLQLPEVQKVLSQSGKDLSFVSGFAGNVWKMLNEFCSIHRLDVRFNDGQLVIGPRSTDVVSGVKWARLEKNAERREKYKQVAIVNQKSKAVSSDTEVLWRSDSVYQLNIREVFETTVQTKHSILSVVNPEPVAGITPYPYKSGGGQYVVTGADGYIIAPQWWKDNGGKIEVSLTEKEGELNLKITAPDVDSVRAPYRISEGAADRPALYISGSGVINDPEELHINTGATKAREGFDTVFESPFIAGPQEAFDTAARMAAEYSASVAEVDYDTPNDFDTPSAFGQYPAGAVFTDNDRNYRIADASQTHSRVSGKAAPHTTIGAYKASYPAGATIADEKVRHRGRTIREFNIKPLRSNNGR